MRMGYTHTKQKEMQLLKYVGFNTEVITGLNREQRIHDYEQKMKWHI